MAFLRFLCLLLWIPLRICFNFIFHTLRIKLKHDPSGDSVHVQKIVARFKTDILFHPCGLSNFLATHVKYADDSYLLQHNVTLYSIGEDEAVFVETDPSVDVTSSSCSAFMRIAQFAHAINVIRVPIKAFFRFTERVGNPSGQVVLVANTSRCGSTLLCQIAESSRQCVSMCEPYAFLQLSYLVGKIEMDPFDRLACGVINALCKPTSKNGVHTYLIKLTTQETYMVKYYTRACPYVRSLFMYRDCLPVNKSIYISTVATPTSRIPLQIACMIPPLWRKLLRLLWTPEKFIETLKPKSILQMSAINWASSLYWYLKLRQSDGIDIAGVRYEDLIEDKELAVRGIMNFLKLDYDFDAVCDVFTRDSQRGTSLSRDILGALKGRVSNKQVLNQAQEVVEIFKLPAECTADKYILPGTISNRYS